VLAYVAGKDEGVRASMRSGDVLLFRGRGLLSWLIRHATHSDYSHAGLLFRYCGRVYCLEAVGKGCVWLLCRGCSITIRTVFSSAV